MSAPTPELIEARKWCIERAIEQYSDLEVWPYVAAELISLIETWQLPERETVTANVEPVVATVVEPSMVEPEPDPPPDDPPPIPRSVPRVISDKPVTPPALAPARDTLTEKQRAALEAMIAFLHGGQRPTLSAIAERVNRAMGTAQTVGGIQSHLRFLISKGYLAREGAGKGIKWRVLRNLDGTPAAQNTPDRDRALIDEAVAAGRVTKCPPGHAHGVGATELERQFGARMPSGGWKDKAKRDLAKEAAK